MAAVRDARATVPLPDLRARGAAPALIHGGRVLSYAQLADLVDECAERLGPVRRLVMVSATNSLSAVVTYLATLMHGHPVLLVASGSDNDQIREQYRPDVVVGPDTGWALDEQVPGTGHDLHPDLTLLLSTSGSTGAPKLVRLSAENVRSNAASIAEYLSIAREDCGVTTLPLHYCYGLSILHSHLWAGGRVLLTSRSVVEEEFWEEFTAARATSLAGVPYTFDLLDADHFAEREVPSLRYVTQAGGRLAPARVRHYAELGRTRGFDFIVMYGATEATARMAYLPPALAGARPACIGTPIPGGSFRIDGPDETGAGELVYKGPNVMLGYAEHPADLASGRTVEELLTGDLARRHEDGLFEVVGRTDRTVKLFGLRLDLDRVEQLLADAQVQGRAVLVDGRVGVFVRTHRHVRAARAVLERCGLPTHAVRVLVVADFPRTRSGKTDLAALVSHARLLEHDSASRPEPTVTPRAVRSLLAELLGRPDATEDDSFTSLGGDSLSFIEVSVRLSTLLDEVPTDWPSLSARTLAQRTHPSGEQRRTTHRRRRGVAVETAVLLRALAIVLIVASHANLIAMMGGAHLLLGVVGFNLTRFHLNGPAPDRVRGLVRAARQVLVPSVLWILGVAVVVGTYQLPTVLMLNNLLGSPRWDAQWHFWYLEVVVWTLVGLALVMSVPAIVDLERRRQWSFALGVVVVTLALRYALVGVTAGPDERYVLPVVLWCVALGWLIARSRSIIQRGLASVATVGSVVGFFDDPSREAVVAGGLLALIWLRAVRIPRAAARVASAVAASSLFTYLTHWQVYPDLEELSPGLATCASLVVGFLVWRGWVAACRAVSPGPPRSAVARPGYERVRAGRGPATHPVRRASGRATRRAGADRGRPGRWRCG